VLAQQAVWQSRYTSAAKCFHDVQMERELEDTFVESVAKNNFEWCANSLLMHTAFRYEFNGGKRYYVSKPDSERPRADFRPDAASLQGNAACSSIRPNLNICIAKKWLHWLKPCRPCGQWKGVVYTGDVWCVMCEVWSVTNEQQQAISGKKDAVDKEIERLLARERDKSRDQKVCRIVNSKYINNNDNSYKNEDHANSNNVCEGSFVLN
jgi:hypothetical protein